MGPQTLEKREEKKERRKKVQLGGRACAQRNEILNKHEGGKKKRSLAL